MIPDVRLADHVGHRWGRGDPRRRTSPVYCVTCGGVLLYQHGSVLNSPRSQARLAESLDHLRDYLRQESHG